MKLAFWLAAGFVAYTYVGYPILLAAIAAFRGRPVTRADITPLVSFVITVHNEERRIEGKLANTLEQSYPRARMEILVASDGSSDRTDDIVRAFEPRGVRLVRTGERGGKEAAQLAAISASGGEILVFSDAGTMVPPDGVAAIVRNFADPSVGCVSSEDRVVDADGAGSGESSYIKYDMLLRRLETRVGSVTGLTGAFFAARREVCRQWAVDLPSDFRTVLVSMRQGLRGVSDPRSLAYYRSIPDESREFQRKVRTIIRGMATLHRERDCLNPGRHGLFAWQLWSHKVCRWLVPFALLVVLFTSAMLLREPVYQAAFLGQAAVYLVALAGLSRSRWTGSRLLRIPTFFLLANVSIVQAWYRFVAGQRVVSWTPSAR
jgi:glycosyltransferase involved in cell wall biosynthesis